LELSFAKYGSISNLNILSTLKLQELGLMKMEIKQIELLSLPLTKLCLINIRLSFNSLYLIFKEVAATLIHLVVVDVCSKTNSDEHFEELNFAVLESAEIEKLNFGTQNKYVYDFLQGCINSLKVLKCDYHSSREFTNLSKLNKLKELKISILDAQILNVLESIPTLEKFQTTLHHGIDMQEIEISPKMTIVEVAKLVDDLQIYFKIVIDSIQ
jgi:hypothetical protein